MSFINYNAKEIHCKVVYYGVSLGGKTTNLQYVYQHTADENKKDMVSIGSDNERTVLFDFLPLDIGEIRGFKTRFHLYTVPGQVAYEKERQLILKGLDGIIFVVDAQESRLEENLAALEDLEKNLNSLGYDLKNIPMIVQYNKSDLDNRAPLPKLRAALNRYNSPDIEACAIDGTGVLESLKTLSQSIITVLKGGTP